MIPFGYHLGVAIAQSWFQGDSRAPNRIWGEFEASFLSSNTGDLEWAKEILSDTTLFAGCALLRLCSPPKSTDLLNYHAQVGYSWLLGTQALLRPLPKPTSTLFLVSKVPQLGCSKTRLARTIGDSQAFQFSQACLLDLCEKLATHDEWEHKVLLFLGDEVVLRGMLTEEMLRVWELLPVNSTPVLSSPKLEGLGLVLSHAVTFALSPTSPTKVCFVGMDTPHLPHEVVRRAHLEAPRIVAARDGGYVLLSLCLTTADLPHIPTAFESIEWSSSLTLATQLQALHRAGFGGIRVDEELLFDVDEEAELVALAGQNTGPRVSEFVKHFLEEGGSTSTKSL